MGVWGRRLNLSPWYSSPWVRFSWLRCWWLGAVAGVGDTSKIASKWKHHSPFTREEMFLNQLGSHLGSLETVPGPLRSASSPSSATKHTPPFAPPSPPAPGGLCFCSGSLRESAQNTTDLQDQMPQLNLEPACKQEKTSFRLPQRTLSPWAALWSQSL